MQEEGACSLLSIDRCSYSPRPPPSDGVRVEQLTEPTSFEMVDDAASSEYPITVKLKHLPPSPINGTDKEDAKSGLYRSNLFASPTEQVNDTGPDGTEEIVRSRYMVGCDGARSWVRK